MVGALITFLHKEIRGLHQAAYLLGAFAFLSQLFALIRDRLLAHTFGAGSELDVYYAAFRIPDFIFISVASLVSLSVLIPFLVDRIEEGHEASQRFVSTIFSFFFLVITGVALIVFMLTPMLVPKLFPGFNASEIAQVIVLGRILLLSPIILGVSNLFASITQVHRRFFIYALSPVLYNIGIIVGIVFLVPIFGITGVVYGVLGGAVLHLLIQVPFILESRLMPRFTLKPDFATIRQVCALSLPRTLTLSMNHVVIIILLSIASVMTTGSITVFTFAYNLQSIPLSIIGVSYSLAAFPVLSELYRNAEIDAFTAKIKTAARHIIFWSIPITVLFIVLRAQIVRIILGSGEFSWSDTRLTAAALSLFAISIVFQGLVVLFVRGFYAAGDTRTPLIVTLVSSGLTVISAYWLYGIFQHSPLITATITDWLKVTSTEASFVLALPFAFTIGACVNGLFLWAIFSRRFTSTSTNIFRAFKHSAVASVGIGLAAYIILNVFDSFLDLSTVVGVFLHGALAGVGGIGVGIVLFVLMDNQEVREVWGALHRKFWKARVVGPDPDVV